MLKEQIPIRRKSGVLLHITSLPSRYGIGDFGFESYQFADDLVRMGQGFWQTLPLNSLLDCPSPYSPASYFAGNSLFISPDLLIEDNFLTHKDLKKSIELYRPAEARGDFLRLSKFKNAVLHFAFLQTQNRLSGLMEYQEFLQNQSFWLDSYCIFTALRKSYLKKGFKDRSYWPHWPSKIRRRELDVLNMVKRDLRFEIEREKFSQYLFFFQWEKLKTYCNKIGLSIVGDMPIYPHPYGADTWNYPNLFLLKQDFTPSVWSGTPPDEYSNKGQLWEVSVYNWQEHKREGFKWFLSRIRHSIQMYDLVRIDHVQGLIAYWSVLANQQKDTHLGEWVETPAEELFTRIQKAWPRMPFIAENLGIRTPKVDSILERFGISGMNISLFLFGSQHYLESLQQKQTRDFVIYSSTHDTNTLNGWFLNESTDEQRININKVTQSSEESSLNWKVIELLLHSDVKLIMIQMQDLLGLDQSCRMNCPENPNNHTNWSWSFNNTQFTDDIKEKLYKLTKKSLRYFD